LVDPYVPDIKARFHTEVAMMELSLSILSNRDLGLRSRAARRTR